MKLYEYGLVIKVTLLKEKQSDYFFSIDEVFKLNLTDIFIIEFLLHNQKVLIFSFYVTKFGVRVYDDSEQLIESSMTPLSPKHKLRTILKKFYKKIYEADHLFSIILFERDINFKLSDFKHNNIDKIKKDFKL